MGSARQAAVVRAPVTRIGGMVARAQRRQASARSTPVLALYPPLTCSVPIGLPPATCCLLSAACCLLPATCCLLPATCYRLPTITTTTTTTTATTVSALLLTPTATVLLTP